MNHHTSTTAKREWSTFTTWCDLTERDLHDIDLDVVADYARTRGWAASTTRNRVRELLSALRAAGVDITPQGRVRPNLVRTDPGLRSPEEILADLPMHDWPHGFAIRRDAFLMVLVGPMGMSRAQVRSLRPADIGTREYVVQGAIVPQTSWTIRGHLVPHGPTLASCGQCQVTLWLGVWSAWLSRFRVGAADWLELHTDYWGHVCDDIEAEAGTAWRTEPVLLPGIDRHGWPSMETLSARQISRIVHRRQEQPRQYLDPRREVPETPRPVSANFGRRPDPDPEGRISSLLDQLDEATDEVMARVKEVLAAVGE